MASALKSHYGKVNRTRMSTTNTPKEWAGADNGNCNENMFIHDEYQKTLLASCPASLSWCFPIGSAVEMSHKHSVVFQLFYFLKK